MDIIKKSRWFLLTLAVILLDQLTKYWAQISLNLHEPVHLMPVMNWTLAHNTGAAFSFLGSAGPWHQWFFMGLSIFVSLLLIAWIIKTPAKARMQLIALSMILGGALGNLIDRILFGHVIDFIQLHWGLYYWPIFNIADTAICVGGFFLILDMLVHRKE